MTRAAARLHLAQQAVSTQLQQLERAVGVTLLVRTSRGVVLTPAGERFLEGAKDLLGGLDSLVAETRTVAGGGAGRLRVAFKAHSTAHFSPLVARALHDLDPPVDLEMFSVASLAEEIALLREGRVDAAFLWLPAGDDGVRSARVLSEPRQVAVAVDHHLAGRPGVSLVDLADLPVVGPHSQLPVEVMRFWLAEPRPDGRPAVRGPEARTSEECLHRVAQGDGVWIAPTSAARYFAAYPVAWVPVWDLPPAELAVAWHGRAGAMIRHLVEESRRLTSTPKAVSHGNSHTISLSPPPMTAVGP